MIAKAVRPAKNHPYAFIFAAGCVLRLCWLNTRSLWFDEAATLYIAQSPWAQVVLRVRALEENPPLHYLLMHFWTMLFSDPVLGLRVFSALCGMGSLALFMILCQRLIPKQAILASLLAASSSFWIHFSQDGRIYSLLLLISLSATYLLLLLHDHWSNQPALLYAGLGTLGLYTHNFFIYVLLAHFSYLVLRHFRRPRALVPWAVLYALMLTCYLPWLSCVIAQIRLLPRASVLTEPLTLKQLCYVIGTMLFDTSFLSFAHEKWTLAVGLSALGATATGTFSLLKRTPKNVSLFFCLVQLTTALLGLRLTELILHRALTQSRYLIFLSPFLYICLALVLDHFKRGPSKFLRAGLLALMGLGTVGYFAGGIFVDPRLSDLSEFLRRKTATKDVIVYLDPFYYLPMRYYYLTERPHYMVGADSKTANWDELPGYKAYLPRRILEQLKSCVVIDPRNQLSDHKVAIASGRKISEIVFPGPRARRSP